MKHKDKLYTYFIVTLLILSGLCFMLASYGKYLNKKSVKENKIELKQDDDKLMAVYIDNVISNSYPASSNYNVTIYCRTDGAVNNSVQTSASWNGSQWILYVSNITKGNTYCTSYFYSK